MPPRLVLAALLVAGALVSGVTALHGIQPNDEGLMLQAVERITDGQVPYRDFWWFYPPGQPYLLAALRELFGPSLLTVADRARARRRVRWRCSRSASRGAAPGRGVSLAAWAAAILAMAYPSGPHPFPIALARSCSARCWRSRSGRRCAGVLVGAAAAWRIEFAAFAGLAILVARPDGLRRFALAGGRARPPSSTLPVVIAAGLGPIWDLLVDYPLTDFRDYQTLPFPLSYDGPLNTSSPGGFVTDSARAAAALLPAARARCSGSRARWSRSRRRPLARA